MEFDFLWDLIVWSLKKLKEARRDQDWKKVEEVVKRIEDETGLNYEGSSFY